MRGWAAVRVCSALAMAAILGATRPAHANSPSFWPGPPPSGSAYEVWAGADVTAHSWSIYSGITWAPFGTLAQDGWRARMVGGYGHYRYDGHPMRFDGEVGFGDLLVGYHMGMGALTVKAFAGVALDSHSVSPFDPDNGVTGSATGVKATLETWLDLSPRTWSSLDLSWTSAHETYAGRLRLGYRLLPTLSVGVEAGAAGNSEYDGGRGGLFLRHEWSGGEISASAGAAGDRSEMTGAYGTLNVLQRF